MLKFAHVSRPFEWHNWPFVYLHGEAEQINMQAFNDGGAAPDICMASEPLANYVPCPDGFPDRSWKGVISIPCMVDDYPAVCVLSSGKRGMFGGRIALVKDFTALQHVMSPDDWQ